MTLRESTIENRLRTGLVTYHLRYLLYRDRRLAQQLFCVADTQIIDILIEITPRSALEHVRKCCGTDTHLLR